MTHRLECEVREVAVSHVLILCAEQKPRRDKRPRVTEHDHCATSHIPLLHVNSNWYFTMYVPVRLLSSTVFSVETMMMMMRRKTMIAMLS